MKMPSKLFHLLIWLTVILAGCSAQTSSKQVELSLEEALQMIQQASLLDYSFYAEPRTREESYDHFKKYYTNHYIDKIVLGTGNLKEEGDKWSFAYEGGELVEGSFINTIYEESSELKTTEDLRVVKLINHIGDGLYAPHREIITFVHTDKGWKIDDLVWDK
ncbi:hypothetical protein [Ammoniphilus sp. CFH 90114]|uniref:hypothetical protein n=1 Tax=Ammoniphilus sp. CFH 90114 TaxID=2493665 RepID=UPI00100DB7CB|nr:hypothetical protein [Ammoniphilus sp. CFH 90114]RXT02279.1 hypothetical protein EIZ39_25030 [Ammoniphilus sp. CFH 90114]